MIVRINVGLNNAQRNKLDAEHVVNLIKTGTDGAANVLDWRVVDSEGGDWEIEEVLWAEIEVVTSDETEIFKRTLESLCVVLNEDAIAVAIVSPSIGEGTILFNPHYEGEKYEFNLDYFTE